MHNNKYLTFVFHTTDRTKLELPMRKYDTLGELLVAYRKFNNISQVDFATPLNIDVRTTQRWENNLSIVKPAKENDLINTTLIPHQVIRNLNSTIPIPTYYDFVIRKYSTSRLGMKTPDIEWVKANININTKQLKSIETKADLDDIYKYMTWQYTNENRFSIEVLEKASKICPELNLILRDNGQYYMGHYSIIPIREYVYNRIKNKEMTNSEITIHDLVENVERDNPVFYSISHSAETNDLLEYLLARIIKYFQDRNILDYTIASFSNRHDTRAISEQMGFKLVWEHKDEVQLQNNIEFFEGHYNGAIF